MRTRKEMVERRTEELSKLNDLQLVATIVKYFEQNATLPGEKAIKDCALSLKAEFDGNVITGLLSQVRGDLIEEFASLCVKEVKLKNVMPQNATKKNKDAKAFLTTDLPMELIDVRPARLNVMVNTYGLAATVSASEKHSCMTEDVPYHTVGSLPEGFKKNHRNIGGMKALVVATDHSNGKFANMSYRMIIDLGQKLAV